MKSLLKKLFFGLLAVSFLTLAAPKKEAKAGFLILAATDQFVLNHKYETLDNLIPYIGFATMIPFGFWFTYTGYSMQTLYSGLFVLDEKPVKNFNNTKGALLNRYPYLDDASALDSLASKILDQYAMTKDTEGNSLVVLSESEILESVESLDLSDAQLTDLVSTLAK
jgi:hypothetical protein